MSSNSEPDRSTSSAQPSPPPIDSSIRIEPTERDAVIWCGGGTNDRFPRYRNLIAAHCGAYENCNHLAHPAQNRAKKAIVTAIYRSIIEGGGRFLTKRDFFPFQELREDKDIWEKIRKALRDKIREDKLREANEEAEWAAGKDHKTDSMFAAGEKPTTGNDVTDNNNNNNNNQHYGKQKDVDQNLLTTSIDNREHHHVANCWGRTIIPVESDGVKVMGTTEAIHNINNHANKRKYNDV